MANSQESKLKHFVDLYLTCAHCKKRYNKPSILLCSHSFCRDCLEELVQTDESVTCLVCQENMLLPKKGIDAVKSNTFIDFLLKYISLLETFGSTSDEPKGYCKLCEGEGVTVYCQECSGAICNTCETQHERMKPFKGHNVIQLRELLDGDLTDIIRVLSKGESEDECISHKGEPLRFYCQQCRTAVCRDCTVVDHNTGDHKVSALDEITDSRRNLLGQIFETLTDRKNRNAEFIASKEQTKQKILEQKAELTSAIENMSTEIVQRIDDQKKHLLDKLEKITTARLMGNEKVFEAAETDHKEMVECSSVSALLLQTARDVDFLQVNNEFIHAIKRQNTKLENASFGSELSRLGIVFKPQIDLEDVNIGVIMPVQSTEGRTQTASSSWGGRLEGSIRDISASFWSSLQE